MRRVLLYSAALLSTLLLLASITFFSRSYFRQEWVALAIRTSPAHLFSLASYPGRLSLSVDSDLPLGPPTSSFPAGSGEIFSHPLFAAYPRWSSYSSQIPKLWPTTTIHEFYLPQGIPLHRFLGFVWFQHVDTSMGIHSRNLMIPYPYLICIFSLLPFLALRHHMKRTRLARHPGLCPTCRYDLRAHLPPSADARCPECGTPLHSKIQI